MTKRGFRQTKEHRAAISVSRQAHLKTHNKEICRCLGQNTHKGQVPWNKGLIGKQIPWNKGLTGKQVAWNKGQKGLQTRSMEYKERKSAQMKAFWSLNRDKLLEARKHVDREAAAIKMHITVQKNLLERRPTSLEYALQMLLEDAGLDYKAQQRFGKYVVDMYVETHNLAFEADGQFWFHHQDRERETRRDEYLLDRGPVAIIHLTDDDLQPWLLAKG